MTIDRSDGTGRDRSPDGAGRRPPPDEGGDPACWAHLFLDRDTDETEEPGEGPFDPGRAGPIGPS